jgi:Holliday junction resolvase RusA-like endonuclease
MPLHHPDKEITIRVPGNPSPAERARARAFVNPRTGSIHATVYTRKGKTKNYRALISMAGSQAMNGQELKEGPLEMMIFFYLDKPKSKSKKKVWPDVKPDLDNYVKAVKDALNGVVYRDDSQVCVLQAFKVYGVHKAPETLILINNLQEDLFYVQYQESLRFYGSPGPEPGGTSQEQP